MKVCRVCGVGIDHIKGRALTCEEHHNQTRRICTACGEPFIAHMYNHRKTCQTCRSVKTRCSVCGKLFAQKVTGKYSEHCSEKCCQRAKYLRTWEGGHYSGNGPKKCSALTASRIEARKLVFAVEKRPELCSVCGDTHEIEVHHIDADPFNNDSKNLDILCKKCHRKEHARLRRIHRSKTCSKR